VRVSPEGDVLVSDDTINGLGTLTRFLEPFFASLLLVMHRSTHPTSPTHMASFEPRPSTAASITAAEPAVLPDINWSDWDEVKPVLMACVPSTGYFAAGGLAGVISRTSTAPLDRLKVYLIAQTKSESIAALKHQPITGLFGHFFRNTGHAIREIWAAGGVRSLFAGMSDPRSLEAAKMRSNRLAGNGINIIKVMPETSIKFGFFEGSKRICAKAEGHNNPKKLSAISKLVSGGVSGMASQSVWISRRDQLRTLLTRYRLFVYPLDTLKL
jgi:solute carrier family 25 phosphate transporter 23/24/25/41